MRLSGLVSQRIEGGFADGARERRSGWL